MRKIIMKYSNLFLLFVLTISAFSQGYDQPLEIQGLNNTIFSSSASRAAGRVSMFFSDPGLMFINPASIANINKIQFSFGGLQSYQKLSQAQHYTPLKYYSNFSLLMEGLTDLIKDPDTSLSGSNPGDTVQRAFDKIGPNWSRSKDNGLPLQVLAVLPFSLFDYNFVLGGGVINYIDLNHYYQNNNVLSPSIGSQRPVPAPLPPNNPDSTFKTLWYQYIRSREGTIKGYGLSLAGVLSKNISIGFNGLFMSGKSDDFEQRLGRGRLVFYYNYFRLDSTNFNRKETHKGESEFSGLKFTLSGIYRNDNITLGLVINPPYTIRREFSKTIQVDSLGNISNTDLSGSDELQMPVSGIIGVAVHLRKNLHLGIEYDYLPYDNVIFRNSTGNETKPWLSASAFRVGINYQPLDWLSIRTGMMRLAEVFEVEGNPLVGEPVRYYVYSTGIGISYSRFIFNLTYEYTHLKYQDMWQTNVNFNKDFRHNIIADIIININ